MNFLIESPSQRVCPPGGYALPRGRKDKSMENNMKDTSLNAALAQNTLDDIPEPKSDAREIVGLVKHSGKIDGYQLSDGSTVTKEEGVRMAKDGDIKGVGVAHRGDSEYLKAIPDGSDDNNLGSLPSISG